MHITQEKVESRTVSTTVAMVCDLCRTRYEGVDQYDWSTEPYRREKTTLTYEYGDVFPEGGTTTHIRVDICPTCFTTRLLPWLHSQGVAPTTYEVEI
jgi:hypothetical protein